MTERQTSAGGIRSQLRSLATRGSLEGEWEQQRPQSATIHRAASLPGEDTASVQVELKARKYFGRDIPDERPRLLTRYAITALLTRDEIPVQFVPPYVKFALQEKRLNDWRRESAHAIVEPTNRTETYNQTIDELILEDLIDISDTDYRFERGLTYTYDGRGHLLHEEVTQTYSALDYSEPDSGIETASHLVGKIDFRNKMGYTQRLIEKDHETGELHDGEFFKHPDIAEMELAHEGAKFRNDLVFAELIQRTEANKELNALSQSERNQKALALLAFLKFDVHSSEVTKLLYD